jgi:hypothetical protein
MPIQIYRSNQIFVTTRNSEVIDFGGSSLLIQKPFRQYSEKIKSSSPTLSFPKSNFSVSLHLHLDLPNSRFPRGLYLLLPSPISAICSVYLALLHTSTLTELGFLISY